MNSGENDEETDEQMLLEAEDTVTSFDLSFRFRFAEDHTSRDIIPQNRNKKLSLRAATAIPMIKKPFSLKCWDVYITEPRHMGVCNQFIPVLIGRGIQRGLVLETPSITINGSFDPEEFADNFALTQEYRKSEFILVIGTGEMKLQPLLNEMMIDNDVFIQGLRASILENVGHLGHISVADYIIGRM